MASEWVLREVRIPKGTHLSNSRANPDSERTLLRENGTNKLLGPTESRPIKSEEILNIDQVEPSSSQGYTEESLSPAQQALADTFAEVVDLVAREVVIPLIRDVAAPALKKKLGTLSNDVRTKSLAAYSKVRTATWTRPVRPVGLPPSKEIEAISREAPLVMSAGDFREHLLRAMAAEQFARQLKESLSNVRIRSEPPNSALERAVQLALEGDFAAFDEETLVILMDFIGDGPTGSEDLMLPNERQLRGPRN